MTTNANGFGLSTFQFKMNDLPDYSEYTELWKWYRIVGIKVEMTPMWGHGAWDENNQVSPTIYSMVHRKNTTLSAPTSLSDLDQVGKLRTHYCAPGKTWSMYFVPNSYMDEGLQAATHGYTPGFKKWIPTQDPTYVHSGCAIYIAGGGAKTYHFQRKRTFYLELKETK